jgi:hypothetical protein
MEFPMHWSTYFSHLVVSTYIKHCLLRPSPQTCCSSSSCLQGNQIIFRCFAKITKDDYWLRHICPSVRPHRTTRLSINGFLRNLIFENLSKICQKFKFHWNVTSVTGTLREDQCAFMIISRSFLLKIRSVSDKSCREYQNKHWLLNNFLTKIVPFMK